MWWPAKTQKKMPYKKWHYIVLHHLSGLWRQGVMISLFEYRPKQEIETPRA